MPGTIITEFSGQQFADRLADLFPRGWASDTAKYSGNVYSLLLSLGQQLAYVQTEVQYAALAQRIQTETSPELDLASIDYLGGTLPRPDGASDAAFAQAIIAALFQPVATRQALSNALQKLTGFAPRMMEPWNVNDTGAWGVGGPSFWNVDNIENPARWGGDQRYQGFIETTPPAIPSIGPNNPVLTWDTAYWNVPGYFFGIIPSIGEETLNTLLNQIRAYGTTVWVKLLSQSGLISSTGIVPPSIVTSLIATPAGTSSVALTWGPPGTGTAPYIYNVYYRITGTSTYIAGPSTSSGNASVTGLLTGTSYDFTVVARNASGASTSAAVTVRTGLVAPSPVQNLVATLVQATAITLSWQAPLIGSTPLTYTIFYRVFGVIPFSTLLVGNDTFAVTIIGLQPNTTYDIEVQASNV